MTTGPEGVVTEDQLLSKGRALVSRSFQREDYINPKLKDRAKYLRHSDGRRVPGTGNSNRKPSMFSFLASP